MLCGSYQRACREGDDSQHTRYFNRLGAERARYNISAFMSFSLLSMPCVAAVAALRRELGTKSTLKVLIFEFITAWTVSFAVYRIALLI